MTKGNDKKITFKKWATALRSGKYPQGRSALCQTVSYDETELYYCCLGVLGAEADQNGDPYAATDLVGLYNTIGYALGRRAGDLLGLEGGHNLFMRMNDDEGKSFEEIADFIEEQARAKRVWTKTL